MPQIVNTVSWELIERHYTDLIANGWLLEPMLSLIKFIKNNDLDKILFPYTSLDTLVVTIYNPAEWHRESIHIQFKQQSETWHFEYFSRPGEPGKVERYYNSEDGISKFSQYIDYLKW